MKWISWALQFYVRKIWMKHILHRAAAVNDNAPRTIRNDLLWVPHTPFTTRSWGRLASHGFVACLRDLVLHLFVAWQNRVAYNPQQTICVLYKKLLQFLILLGSFMCMSNSATVSYVYSGWLLITFWVLLMCCLCTSELYCSCTHHVCRQNTFLVLIR